MQVSGFLQDVQESVILGCDQPTRSRERAKLGILRIFLLIGHVFSGLVRGSSRSVMLTYVTS